MRPEFKMLCLFDHNAATGFATVSHNIIDRFRAFFGKRLILDIVAINFIEHDEDGTAQAGKAYYLDEDKRQAVHPAIAVESNAIDPLGRHEFLRLLRSHDYNIVFVIQDPGVMAGKINEKGENTGNLFAEIKKIKKQKRDSNVKNFKLVWYFPIDGVPLPEWFSDLDAVDLPVAYTDYARSEVYKIRPDMRGKVKSIPHGIDTQTFYRFHDDDKKYIRKEIFGPDVSKKLIIGNVNRNQTRKDIPSTIFAFEKYLREFNKDAFLYLHMARNDPQGWNLPMLLKQTSLKEGIDYMFQEKESRDITPGHLNQIYNSLDFYLTTTTGEGWGLCVHPDTIINTSFCFKEIKKIKTGDKVMSEDGLYHQVRDVISRRANVLKIKICGCPEIIVTPQHPFAVIRNAGLFKSVKMTKPEWISAKYLFKNDLVAIVKPILNHDLPIRIDLVEWVDNVQCDDGFCWFKMGYSPHSVSLSLSEIARKYNVSKRVAEDAKNLVIGKLTKGRYKPRPTSVAYGIAQQIIKSNVPVRSDVCKVNRFIDVNDEFLELIGWYLAEGSANGGAGIELSLHRKELPIAEKIAAYITSAFGVKGVVGTKQMKSFYRCSSSIVSKFLSKYCGNYAPNKRINSAIFLCGGKLAPLIKSVFLGDGHITDEFIRLSTTSRELIWQIRDVLLSQGVFCTVANARKRPQERYRQYTLSIQGAAHAKMCAFIGLPYKSSVIRKRGQHYLEDDRFFYTKIKSIVTVKKKQTVFDISVEDIHSFVGNGILLHNTVTESMACGVPVIAPYHTSILDISGGIDNRLWCIEGLRKYVSDFDNMLREQVYYEDLAEDIDTIVRQSEKTKAIVNRAEEYVKQLNWDILCLRWIDEFEDLL